MKLMKLARRRCSLRVESLEPRWLLSASVPDIQPHTETGTQVVKIAAVSHGYELSLFGSGIPAWETTMVKSLYAQNFKSVEAFDWKSYTAQPNYAIEAGLKLASDIKTVVQNPNIVPPGSVVDLVLIGRHSRGAVVVNRAFQALQNHLSSILQLTGEYLAGSSTRPTPLEALRPISSGLTRDWRVRRLTSDTRQCRRR